MNKLKFKYGNGVFEFEVEGNDDFVKEKTEWATTIVSQTQNNVIQSGYAAEVGEPVKYIDSPLVKDYNGPVQFLLDKNFSTELDETLGLVYFMEKFEKKSSWAISDLQNEYSIARKKLPSNLSRNITANIGKGYIINPNREEKRIYCLTPEGEMYIENYISKGKDHINKQKSKKASVSKQIDPEESEKIDLVKQDIEKYESNVITILENVKGQKDQTLLGAYLIYLRFGEEFQFTPKVVSSILKKLGVSLDSVQAIKVISANSKYFDNTRRGWYTLNKFGVKFIKQNIMIEKEEQ